MEVPQRFEADWKLKSKERSGAPVAVCIITCYDLPQILHPHAPCPHIPLLPRPGELQPRETATENSDFSSFTAPGFKLTSKKIVHKVNEDGARRAAIAARVKIRTNILLHTSQWVRWSRCQSQKGEGTKGCPQRAAYASLSLSLTIGICWRTHNLAANHSSLRYTVPATP